MPSRDIIDCDPILQKAWNDGLRTFLYMNPGEPEPFLTCTYRSNAEQMELYAKGRTEAGQIVTQIRRNGKHNKKPAQAFDIAFKKKNGTLDWSPALFQKFAHILAIQSPMVKWGGDWASFKDYPHFEI
jgi:peptidoglycan L-alanyl-D-glutamate endopeptidase CwlK